MAHSMPFGDVLEAVDQLSADEQEALVSILHHRLAEEGRKRVASDVRELRQEFAAGGCRPTTPDDLMREISS
jgi:hypothetical protein